MDLSDAAETHRRSPATVGNIAEHASSIEETDTASIRTRLRLWPLVRYALAVATGALFAVMLARRYGQTADVSLRTVIVAAFLSIGVVTFALGLFASPPVLMGFLVLIGISAGVVANAAFDWRVNGADHDLLPIEIVVISLFALPGTIAGLWLASLLRAPRAARLHN